MARKKPATKPIDLTKGRKPITEEDVEIMMARQGVARL